MGNVFTNVSVVFVDTESKDKEESACDLSIEENSEDNIGSPEIGKTTFLRIFLGEGVSDLSIFSTSGNSSLGEEGTALVGENEDYQIVFDGTSFESLKYPVVGEASVEKIGNFYHKDGTVFDNPIFTISPNGISIQKEAYGIVKVSYLTSFIIATFIPSEFGEALVIARGLCNKSSAIIDAVTISTDDIDENEENTDSGNYCDLSIEISEEDNINTNYSVGNTYYARVFSGRGISVISPFNSNGTLVFNSRITSQKEITVAFNGEREQTLSSKCFGEFNYSAIGDFYNMEGIKISTPSMTISDSGYAVISSVICFGIIAIEYITEYDKYSFSFNDEIESTLGVIGNSCNGEIPIATLTVDVNPYEKSSSCCYSSGASLYTDVTLVYKDFITGNTLENVSISLDGSHAGVTNEVGEVLLRNIEIGRKYLIKGIKEGYLNTDSDSLSNDSFIVLAS